MVELIYILFTMLFHIVKTKKLTFPVKYVIFILLSYDKIMAIFTLICTDMPLLH